MNEQIKELAEQVGFGWDDKYHWYVSSLEMERFAELIVWECANWAFSDDNERKSMLKHFGFE